MNDSKLICVLLVEDNQEVATRVQICLRQFDEIPFEVIRAGIPPDSLPKQTIDSRAKDMHFEVTWVSSLAEAMQKIAQFHFDVLILDCSLPDTQGLSGIHACQQLADATPIIILVEHEDDLFIQSAMKAGIKAHALKNDAGYQGLIRLIRYVLHRADVETRNQLLVAALKATSNAIIITDREARIEWINPAFTQLSGYSFQEAMGRRTMDLLQSGVHNAAFYQKIWQKLTNGEHWQGEIINKHKDNSLFNADVGISPVLDNSGSLSGYVEIQRDITDSLVLLSVSEVLQQTSPLETRFQQILDILFTLKSFELKQKGSIFLYDACSELLQVFVLSGHLESGFIATEIALTNSASLSAQVIRSGDILVADDCYCLASHQHALLDMQAHGHYVVPLASGMEILGTLFLYTDPFPLQTESRLTMLKQVGEMMALAIRQEEAKNALERARDLAMQASLVKSEFLANMSHEIRTPMNGVLGMLELLSDTKLTSTQQDWVKTAHSSAEALLGIINDILDFSKLEAGKFVVENVEFNLIDLVDDISTLLAAGAFAKGLELNCSMPVPMPTMWRGDPVRIRQVLTNLIGNAIKFTEQGEIYIKIHRTPLSDNQDKLCFEVHDTGMGITKESQEQLFKPFSQADSATSRRFGGSGLGLSISKRLVELMGGEIGMESNVGFGSCFWFELPMAYLENQNSPDLAFDLIGKLALIVDDNATNRNILTNYLNSWGLTVNEADNGSAALMQLQTSALQGVIFDLILLDVQMPIMDGLTLAKCLAHVPALATIPIILISSGDQFELEAYQNTSIVQRLLKPVRQMQLFDTIIRALKMKDIASQVLQPARVMPSYHDKKVLVVEDNKINQKVIVAKLEKFGIVPDVAENGQIAVNKLREQRYDLIFMDCQMPVMDGYQATQELRQYEMAQRLPRQTVIALTANALEGDRVKCLDMGMDDYLTKPIVSEQLIQLLSEYLGMAVADAELSSKAHHGSENSLEMAWNPEKALQNLDGDKELLFEMINLFLTEWPKQRKQLIKVREIGDFSAVANSAHTIKGSITYFYADKAKDYAHQLEQTTGNGNTTDIGGLVDSLIEAVNELTHQLLKTKEQNKL